jgi:hypothetical protein
MKHILRHATSDLVVVLLLVAHFFTHYTAFLVAYDLYCAYVILIYAVMTVGVLIGFHVAHNNILLKNRVKKSFFESVKAAKFGDLFRSTLCFVGAVIYLLHERDYLSMIFAFITSACVITWYVATRYCIKLSRKST